MKELKPCPFAGTSCSCYTLTFPGPGTHLGLRAVNAKDPWLALAEAPDAGALPCAVIDAGLVLRVVGNLAAIRTLQMKNADRCNFHVHVHVHCRALKQAYQYTWLPLVHAGAF